MPRLVRKSDRKGESKRESGGEQSPSHLEAASLVQVGGALAGGSSASAALSIVNGSEVTDPSGTYPFFALPANAGSDNWLGCGASIISPTFALSSAHCFGGGATPCTGPKQVDLWLGDLQLNDYTISPIDGGRHARVSAELQCHPSWDGKCSHGNDIALLKLSGDLPTWLTPVVLNLQGTAVDAVGSPLTVLGFGVKETTGNSSVLGSPASRLRQATIHVQRDDAAGCATVYAGGFGCSDKASEGAAQNYGHQMCGGTNDGTFRDSCAGDSGGPVLDTHGVQVGIVSYGGGPDGANFGPGRSCGDPNYPGIYARISGLANFVTQHVTDLPA
eukprot:TRINITY_DN16816_c0_g1_i2.p1 TRINITY_DN16816_c0_g1~~TRINITY_DN16816_c0_g1_i2.p1  ORF type:complete len:331 (+),score=58.60 TRINITY_DN16816_c0_g1_i2:204-1196(+)